MTSKKLWFEKTYLDEMPELDNTVRDFFKTLDLGSEIQNTEDYRIGPIDCRRYDGFIPAKHNHGGWDVTCFHSFDYGNYDGTEDDEGELIHVGVRFMYEGIKNDVHTAVLHLCSSVDQYYGAFGPGPSTEIEIVFHNKTDLLAALESHRKAMEP